MRTDREERLRARSDEDNEILMEELRDVVGDDALADPESPLDLPERRPVPAWAPALRGSRLLVLVIAAAAVVIAAFLTVITGSWWFLAGTLVVHGLGTVAVIFVVMRMLGQVETLDPTTVTKLEARGVEDPEAELNELIKRVEGRPNGTEASAADPAGQQRAWTPSSEGTRPVGR